MPLELVSIPTDESLSRSDYRTLLLVIEAVHTGQDADDTARIILENLGRLIPHSTAALGVPLLQLRPPVPGPYITAGFALPIAATDWVARHRGHHSLGMVLVAASGPVATLILQRPPWQPDFSEREREIMHLLEPHFGRALGSAPAREREGAPLASQWSFSERQQEIVAMILDGRSNKEIAAVLDISTETVKDHLRRMFTRLRVQSRGELAARVLGLR